MRPFLLSLLAATTLATAAAAPGVASAQPPGRFDGPGMGPGGPGRWDGNINQRQAEIYGRIDAGVRSGALTRNEGAQLRAEFQAIVRIEADYRRSGRGLTPTERAHLDRRLDMLERRLRADAADGDRRWSNLDRRQAVFDQRLDQAVRERRVSQRAAASLRMEFRDIARLERQYRMSRPGITPQERADLNARFNRMEANFRAAQMPNDSLFDMLFGLMN